MGIVASRPARRAGYAFLFVVATLTLTFGVPVQPDPAGGATPHFFFLPPASRTVDGGRDLLPSEATDPTGPVGQEEAPADSIPELPPLLAGTRPLTLPHLRQHLLAEPACHYRSVRHAPPVPPPRID
jgi:hypothetical protein